MKAEIEIAMRMLLKSDSSIPPDGRIDRAVDVIRGTDKDLPEIVKFNEVCKVLQMTRRSIEHMLDTGRLNRVMGSGSRCIGVSRESLRRVLRGEVRAIDGTLIAG